MVGNVLRAARVIALLSLAHATEAAGPHYSPGAVAIVKPAQSDGLVDLAATELQRYAYLRTGSLPKIGPEPVADRPAILLRTGPSDRLPPGGPDPSQNHAIYIESESPLRIVVHGASAVSTLWAAYSLIESWGFGFYLGGDTVPPRDPKFKARAFEASYEPVLAIRGSLPWLNFLNSPTTWNPQDYKTFFERMARQKANLVMFHVYDHEPFCAYAIEEKKAKMGGPLMTTISPHRWWSPHAMSTKDFLFGTDLFFDRGEWGCEVGIDDGWAHFPGRAVRAQQRMFAEALRFAKRRGLRVALGFEATGNSDDAAVRAEFERRLRHVLKTYPIDYFCLWQSEGRGAGGQPTGTSVTREVAEAFAYLGEKHDLSEAARITEFVNFTHRLLAETAPEVRLIVSGWGGDEWMRFTDLLPGLDKLVPDDVIFSALDNIDPRLSPHVSRLYAQVKPSRECWPIPWFESDGGYTRQDQTGPQTNVTAFEPLLNDLVGKRCEGALGIHWRTRNVEDVVAYLLRFSWNRDLTPEQFFRAYARHHYGPEAEEEMTRVHLRLEEFGPQYVGAIGCTECFTGFTWFAGPYGRDETIASHRANLADVLPDANRFPELERLATKLARKAQQAAERGDQTAATSFHDLSATITWLLNRTRTGSAIWNPAAPLELRLAEAERRVRRGQVTEARRLAGAVLADLEQFGFKRGLQVLATTARTRGELGLLATANARYGRFYAAFVQRLAALFGEPLPASRGSGVWDGEPVQTVFPVPNRVTVGESVSFDAVLLPPAQQQFHVELRRIDAPALKQELPLVCLGGAYHRAVFNPAEPGVWEWRLRSGHEERSAAEMPPPAGILTVGPPAPAIPPGLGQPPGTGGHRDPVLVLDFDQPLDEIGKAVGDLALCPGVRGTALDTRKGGYLRIAEDSAVAAFPGPFSITLFVQPEEWNRRRWPVILSKGEYAGAGYFIQLFGDRLRIGLGCERTLDAPPLEAEHWTHLAVTYDGAELVLYVDGGMVAARLVDEPPGVSDQPLRIGAYRDPGDPEHFPFRGCIDELRFYDRALTEAQVGALAER